MRHFEIDPARPLPARGDVYEETGVRHQPRRYQVVGEIDRWENCVPRIGLKRIKPDGRLANTTAMYGVRSLQDEEGMRLVSRAEEGSLPEVSQ